jgi:hypothetical protein
MNSPQQTYNSQKNKDVLRREAFTFFNEKYFKRPFEEYDLFETQERMAVRKLKFFIPGRIYTFQYDPLMKDYLDYYDKRPMLLVHSQFVAKSTGNMIVQGLNLNFLPEEQRVQTLELFYRIYQNDIKNAEVMAGKEQPGFLREAWKFLTDWYFTVKVFNEQGRIGYQWAYRNYILPRIAQPVIIEFEDWEMIPYFIPKEFNGKPPAKVWSEYLAYKDQLSKKPVDQNKSKQNQKKYLRPGG